MEGQIEIGVEEANDEEDDAIINKLHIFIKRISDLPDKRENCVETPALSPPRETTLSLIDQLLHQRRHLMFLHVCHLAQQLLAEPKLKNAKFGDDEDILKLQLSIASLLELAELFLQLKGLLIKCAEAEAQLIIVHLIYSQSEVIALLYFVKSGVVELL